MCCIKWVWKVLMGVLEMKKEINKGLRVALIILTVTGAFIFSVLLYREALCPSFEERKVPLYNYKSRTAIDYMVYFKPNILYKECSPSENNIFITNFVDYIQTSFTYEFIGEQTADISGDYEITAIMEGYVTENDKHKTIWKKKFNLMQKESFKVRDQFISIRKKIPIKLEEYNNFVTQLIEESKVGSQVKLTVFMNVSLNAETDKGLIKEKYTPTMIIPLNAAYFEIIKSKAEEKAGTIEEVRKVQVPPDKVIVIMLSMTLFISSAALICLIFFTESAPKADPLVSNLNRILKNHSSRLVALTHDISPGNAACYKVKSFEDIIKIADEVEKPILYKYSCDIRDITSFYVIDNAGMYVYNLKDLQCEIPGKVPKRSEVNFMLKTDNKVMMKFDIPKEESQTEDV